MSILVVGSIALDTVQTPFGKVEEALGGSAVYFGVSASHFTDVRLVGVVGEDFPEEHIALLKKHKVDIKGLKKVPGKTFRWAGSYSYDLNQANTLKTELNVFGSFRPEIPDSFKTSDYVFLANIDPELQLDVLKQVSRPRVVACDTMNFWIERKRNQLLELLKYVDILTINEAESRQLTGENNLVKATRKIFGWGPGAIVIKRGEYGALFFTKKQIFSAPAYPLEIIFDPTGAGDSFAGGFMGYLASCGKNDQCNLRRAMIFGSVMASFNVEDFSLRRLSALKKSDIKKRFTQFKNLTHFDLIK
jgi:sugar/nucleoside kinase (ribokinase family)